MPPDPHPKVLPSIAGQVLGDIFRTLHPVLELEDRNVLRLRFKRFHALWERVVQATEYVEENEVWRGRLIPDEITRASSLRVALEYRGEVPKILRDT